MMKQSNTSNTRSLLISGNANKGIGVQVKCIFAYHTDITRSYRKFNMAVDLNSFDLVVIQHRFVN